MASELKNLSEYSQNNITDISKKVFGIVVAEWNSEITEALYNGAYNTLIKEGAKPENIIRKTVPGSFELTIGSQWLAQKKKVDAVIAIGCVIQGDTKHFDFICNAVANGITQVSINTNKPVIFGVLTPNTQQQAIDRAGGIHGNKGDEAAITAIKMLGF
ncbi:MAG: hypothetical protein RLZZ175_940 [Bacteroidota bacterium]|jgi:6,7-dimethyl-8-ribityllumazine synthase